MEDFPAARGELIQGYYSMRDHVPPRVTVDGEVADESLLSSWLSEKAGRRVQIAVPQRGEQAQLMEMCRSNAAEKLAEHLAERESRRPRSTSWPGCWAWSPAGIY